MAGSFYLGSQKVCPALLIGGGQKQINCLFRIPDNVKTISKNYFLDEKFADFPYPIDVDFNNLEVISGNSAFSTFIYDQTEGGTAIIKNLKTISGSFALQNAFYVGDLNYYVDADFSKLETLSGEQCLSGTFVYCNFINPILSFDSLTSISGNACMQLCFAATNVSEIYFRALTSQSFGGKTNQFSIMLIMVDGCVVHFPSNLESVIGSWSDVVGGFGGTNTTVLFDLPETE